MPEVYYFLVYPRNNRSRITVVQLSRNGYADDKSDYEIVNDKEYEKLSEAMNSAKKIANKYNLTYEEYNSRYNDESEYLYSDDD